MRVASGRSEADQPPRVVNDREAGPHHPLVAGPSAGGVSAAAPNMRTDYVIASEVLRHDFEGELIGEFGDVQGFAAVREYRPAHGKALAPVANGCDGEVDRVADALERRRIGGSRRRARAFEELRVRDAAIDDRHAERAGALARARVVAAR